MLDKPEMMNEDRLHEMSVGCQVMTLILANSVNNDPQTSLRMREREREYEFWEEKKKIIVYANLFKPELNETSEALISISCYANSAWMSWRMGERCFPQCNTSIISPAHTSLTRTHTPQQRDRHSLTVINLIKRLLTAARQARGTRIKESERKRKRGPALRGAWDAVGEKQAPGTRWISFFLRFN